MKNSYKITEDKVIIYIKYKGDIKECFIDKEYFDLVNSFNTTWNINVNKTGHIDGIRTKVQKEKIRRQIWIHRLITNCPYGSIIDHIDGNVFNNLKENLRIVDFKVNSRNSKINKNTQSGYRNIYIEKGFYAVRINNKRFGRYQNIEQAKEIAELNRRILFPECKRVEI